MSADDLVTCCLIHLSVGSLIWLVLDGLGIIENTFAARNQVSSRAMLLATLMMIVAWPAFVYAWVKGMRRPAR